MTGRLRHLLRRYFLAALAMVAVQAFLAYAMYRAGHTAGERVVETYSKDSLDACIDTLRESTATLEKSVGSLAACTKREAETTCCRVRLVVEETP